MKKLSFLIATCVCVAMLSSCCNCDKRCDAPKGPKGGEPKEMCKGGMPAPECDMPAELKADFDKWMKFDELSADEQKALIAKRKADIDKREAERKAFEEKWANFDNLSIAEQKEVIDIKSGCHQKPCCPMGGQGKCDRGHRHGNNHCMCDKQCGKPCNKTCDKPCNKPCDKPNN